MAKTAVRITAPFKGEYPDFSSLSLPPEAFTQLLNWRLENGKLVKIQRGIKHSTKTIPAGVILDFYSHIRNNLGYLFSVQRDGDNYGFIKSLVSPVAVEALAEWSCGDAYDYNPRYDTGSVTTDGTSWIVTGNGTLWSSGTVMRPKANDYLYIDHGAGYVQYKINRLTDDTHIELVHEAVPPVGINLPYFIVNRLETQFPYFVDSTWFTSISDGIPRLYLTDGLNPIFYVSEVNQRLVPLPGTHYYQGQMLPSYTLQAKIRAKFISEMAEKLFVANTIEGEESSQCPTRLRCTNIGNPEGWHRDEYGFGDASFWSIGRTDITALEKCAGVLALYNMNEIWRLTPTYDNQVIARESVARQGGCIVQGACCEVNNTNVFITDDNIYRYDGFSEPKAIGDPIKRRFFEGLRTNPFVRMKYYSDYGVVVIVRDHASYPYKLLEGFIWHIGPNEWSEFAVVPQSMAEASGVGGTAIESARYEDGLRWRDLRGTWDNLGTRKWQDLVGDRQIGLILSTSDGETYYIDSYHPKGVPDGYERDGHIVLGFTDFGIDDVKRLTRLRVLTRGSAQYPLKIIIRGSNDAFHGGGLRFDEYEYYPIVHGNPLPVYRKYRYFQFEIIYPVYVEVIALDFELDIAGRRPYGR